MELRKHLSALSPEDRERFAQSCGTTSGHLRNVMYGYRHCSPELAADIERASAGVVTRREMRPSDWQRIWPELATPPEAQDQHAAPAAQQGVQHA